MFELYSSPKQISTDNTPCIYIHMHDMIHPLKHRAMELLTSMKRTSYKYQSMEKWHVSSVAMVVLLLMAQVQALQAQMEHKYLSLTSCRGHTASLADFGGVGDGKTLNTRAFEKAIGELSKHQDHGGSLLYVPPGKWLTGSFNLTNQFTLFLDKNAIILASQEEHDYPVIEPLPSYGQGRDAVGPRFSSLIMGYKLDDVVITGDNGSIDGQGGPWWRKFKANELKNTRPYLVELVFCNDVLMSNVTLKNSPSWHVHPVYGANMIFRHITIVAPVHVPNTDGINPDSLSNTLIEDCYIVSGDDCVAVKSGWDKFGIDFNMPTRHLLLRRLTCISPHSAAVAIGSEMSGGISDIRIEDVTALHSESGVRIKTAPGRGGYVKDIYARNLVMYTMKMVFWMNGDYGSHPGNNSSFSVKDLPEIKNVNYRDIVAQNVTMAGDLAGMRSNKFTNICMSNVTIGLAKNADKTQWKCTDIEGISRKVKPAACNSLPEAARDCDFPNNKLPIELAELRTCSYNK